MFENLDMSFDDDLLLKLTVDSEFRDEISVDIKDVLPSTVSAHDLSFVELLKFSGDEDLPNCINTCSIGYTLRCDLITHQPSPREPLPGCTCVSGFTIICDGSSNAPPPPTFTNNSLGIFFCGF
jgi:hypothetical protein